MRRTEAQKYQRNKRKWEEKHPGRQYPGVFFSPETRAKISARNSGKNNAMFGLPGTRVGRVNSPESIHKTVSTSRGVDDEDCPIIIHGSRTEQVLFGSLLGDGHIRPNGKFSETHCEEQKEIVFELSRLLSPYFLHKQETKVLTRLSKYHKRQGIEKLVYRTLTPALPTFKQLRALWYPSGVKTIPAVIASITPQILAFWYLGDGYYDNHYRRVFFCTEGFTQQENNRLAKILSSNFNLHSARVTTKNQISLSWQDTLLYLPLISEYIMPSMRYKLGPLEDTYKTYNPHHYDPEPPTTERMLKNSY